MRKYKRPNKEDVRVGGKIGRLLLLKEARTPHGGGTDAGYLCRCDCGNEKLVSRSNLLSGAVVSCGCFHKEVASKKNATHGKSNDRIYRIWREMKTRCFDKNSAGYKGYGGRGIVVCDKWKNSFDAFYGDMGDPPGDDYSIDRIDNNGNYEPGNCRWATPTQQARNRSTCIMADYNGDKMCVAEIAERVGVSAKLIYWRLEHGWDVESAINTPPIRNGNNHLFMEKERNTSTEDRNETTQTIRNQRGGGKGRG